MPRYDFKCSKCGVTFEAIAPVELYVMSCVDCSKTAESLVMAERQLSAPAKIHIH